MTGTFGNAESLCDPSFKNRIILLTYPIIGYSGEPKLPKLPNDVFSKDLDSVFYESQRIHATGLIVGEYCDYSQNAQSKTLSQWLSWFKVPALHGTDTRKLTKILREKGPIVAKIFINTQSEPQFESQTFSQPNNVALVELVSTKVYL